MLKAAAVFSQINIKTGVDASFRVTTVEVRVSSHLLAEDTDKTPASLSPQLQGNGGVGKAQPPSRPAPPSSRPCDGGVTSQ